jgi:hypothetical protein
VTNTQLYLAPDDDYATEFHPCELGREPELVEEPEVYTCPTCNSSNVEFAHYDNGEDSQTGYSDSGSQGYCLECCKKGPAEDFGWKPEPVFAFNPRPDALLELARSIDLRNLVRMPIEMAISASGFEPELERLRRAPAVEVRPVAALPEVA